MVIFIQVIKKTVWRLLPPGLLLFVLSLMLPVGMAEAGKTLNPVLLQNPNIQNLSKNHVRPLVYDYVAVMSDRSQQQGKVNVFGALWTCRDARCTTSASWAGPTVEACKALARSVGVIHSYGGRGVSLNKKDINRCNANISIRKKPVWVKEKLSDPVATLETPVLNKKIGVVPKSRTGKGRSSSRQIAPRIQNDLTSNLKNQAGRGLATEGAGSRELRMVLSPRSLEMTGLDEGRFMGSLRMVTAIQSLEMTGVDVDMATSRARAVTPSGGSRTVLSMQVLEMTGLNTGSDAVRSRTVISSQALEMTGR